ncbi:MAG TPA: iron-sulfur cluster assembly protein [Rugosimonospora sp.]|nr:iron-sulfur cluster assembly protein [Rugosimonospora sp.]
MPTPAEIRDHLRRVPEPCALLMRRHDDIVAMGLVDGVECHDGHVRVELVLTDASCVHFGGLQRYIRDVLTGLPGVRTVAVTASRTKLWTPDRRLRS